MARLWVKGYLQADKRFFFLFWAAEGAFYNIEGSPLAFFIFGRGKLAGWSFARNNKFYTMGSIVGRAMLAIFNRFAIPGHFFCTNHTFFVFQLWEFIVISSLQWIMLLIVI